METHFDSFFKIQKTAFEIISLYSPKNKLLEEYISLFPDDSNTSGFNYNRFKENIQPLITMAHNNGFGYMYDK